MFFRLKFNPAPPFKYYTLSLDTVYFFKSFTLHGEYTSININDMDENEQCTVSNFASDTKIGDIVDSEGDYQELQQDFDQLGKWVEE